MENQRKNCIFIKIRVMKQHSLWIELFRPTKLENYICSPELKEKLQSYINEQNIPHLIFAGPAGLGKSTIAKLLVKNIDCDYLYINASDENGIDTIREKVKSFASTASFKPLKIVILEEASFLTGPAQEALKNIIEEYSLNTRFIFTANYLGKIVEPIQSRCEVYEMKAPSKGDIAKHLVSFILEPQGIKYDLKDLVPLINEHYPDIRATVKYLQSGVKDNEFKYSPNKNNLGENLLNILKQPTKNSWYDCRQLVIDAQLDDYQPIIEYLFTHIDQYGKGYEAEITIELDNHQFFQKSVPDKEINFASLISKILKVINNKQILKG